MGKITYKMRTAKEYAFFCAIELPKAASLQMKNEGTLLIAVPLKFIISGTSHNRIGGKFIWFLSQQGLIDKICI